MQINRLARDFAILVILSGGIWAAYQTWTMLGGNNDNNAVGEAFSPDRVAADRAFSANRWADAIEPYQRLVQDDPFNAAAWFRLGESNWRYGQILLEDLKRAESSETDAAQLEEKTRQIDAIITQAREAFEQARTFLQFRNEAQMRLAEIAATRGDYDQAFQLLRATIGVGHATVGIDRNRFLLKLDDVDPTEFRNLVRLERENLERRRRSGQRNVSL